MIKVDVVEEENSQFSDDYSTSMAYEENGANVLLWRIQNAGVKHCPTSCAI